MCHGRRPRELEGLSAALARLLPIALYPAISPAERVSFRQVNRQTGNRLRQQLVDFVTGEVVQSHERGRGYEVGQNQFLMVEEEELQTAQQEAKTRPYSAVPASLIRQEAEEDEEPEPAPPPKRGALSRREEPRRAESPPVVPPRRRP